MNEDRTIYEFIIREEQAYKKPIHLNESWDWSMYDHIKTSLLYKHSQLVSKKDDFTPVKNITRPILNLQYRAEGFDVKDIMIFVNDNEDFYKSLILKKYHELWARDNDIDTFIDEVVESYVDYGAALVKKMKGARPEVVPLPSIALCDQTDLLSGPIGIKHYFAPDQLMDMAKAGWGETKNGATISLADLVRVARSEKRDKKSSQVNETPGKYIEVYEVHGSFPKRFAGPDTTGLYENRIFICAFYQSQTSRERTGQILYTAPESDSPFKLIKRDPIYGRALGFGGAEELFDPQVWVNLDMIRMQGLLDATSKTILKTTDGQVAKRNNATDMKNLEIIELQQGTDLSQVDTTPRGLQLFEQSVAEWEAHAKEMGSATGALLGTLQGGQRMAAAAISMLTSQGQAIHDYRKGKLATFVGEVYHDWIIPQLSRDVSKGKEFLAELDLDELEQVSNAVIENFVRDQAIDAMLRGELVTQDMVDQLRQQAKDEFAKGGNKRFMQILDGEMREVPIDVEVSITNKQKDLSAKSDLILKVLTFVSNPNFLQVMSVPGISKSFNEFLESSGLSPIDFSGLDKALQQPPGQPPQGQPGQQPGQPQLPQGQAQGQPPAQQPQVPSPMMQPMQR